MDNRIKKLTTTGMLCALAYVTVVFGRIPLILFLKYDPKDVIIAIGGLIFGPLTAFAVSFIVSLVEMFTISDNGILGFIMNVIASCAFACPAAFVYKKKHSDVTLELSDHSLLYGRLPGGSGKAAAAGLPAL